ncbi:MAG: hypothetical protein JRJ03_00200 [Deltaproteobacteria bacterium]|nr:hypothetical protein [Deltaproteobacteria bacterium]
MERGVKDLYTEIARNTENPDTAKILRILAAESEAHAKVLELRYGTFGNPASMDEGVKGLLSLLGERIRKIKRKIEPSLVLQEGIEIEKYMEELYKGLADNYKMEAQVMKSLGKEQKDASKIGEIFDRISSDERRHRDILEKHASQMLKEGAIREV